MTKTILILSGGLDSTVLAYHLNARADADLIGAVSVNYGQRHKRELECASLTCQRLSVRHHLVDLSHIRSLIDSSALTGLDAKIPEGHYAAENMKATVVPNRNMILIALAIGVAINEKAEAVAYGAHSGDHAIYPDCRPAFYKAMFNAANLCDYQPRHLVAPMLMWTKADIVTRGSALRVPFDETHSCYAGERIACGRCGTCVERLEAFAIARVTDPLEYADMNYWKEAIRKVEKKPHGLTADEEKRRAANLAVQTGAAGQNLEGKP